MTKTVFLAFSAYVGRLLGAERCAFWVRDPSDGSINWAEKSLYEVDLTKTVSAARNGQISWDDVQIDDHTSQGGLSTIGPRFPGGSVIGAAWLSEKYAAKLGLSVTDQPDHAHSHELRCVVYDQHKKYGNRRFQGFHCRVHGKAKSGGNQDVTRVELWNAGGARAGGNGGMWWLDLDDIADLDESDVGARAAPEGSLYLDSDLKRTYLAGGGTGPKVPPSLGYDD